MKNRRPAGMEPIAYRAKLFWILLTLAIYGFLLGSMVQGGIFFHKKQVMNREQIVYVSVVKTPAYYLLGTCTLLVQAAGAQIVLGWLPKQKANALLYRLSEREEGAL